uniref:Uncharacterized protein n=1 Tax=Salix viminalis TaxID=40686 RepID=A0A6N2KM25_SALVM
MPTLVLYICKLPPYTSNPAHQKESLLPGRILKPKISPYSLIIFQAQSAKSFLNIKFTKKKTRRLGFLFAKFYRYN